MVDYFNRSKGTSLAAVTSVSEINNSMVKRRFGGDLLNIIEKNKAGNLRPTQIVRLLWHGSVSVCPTSIATSESGIDPRLPTRSMMGKSG